MQYLEICLLTTKALCSFNFLFFRVLLLPQQNEIQLVSRFFLSSKPFGPGNWIQSKLAMPISVMNARGELPYKSDGDARRLALACKSQILLSRYNRLSKKSDFYMTRDLLRICRSPGRFAA